MTSNLPPDYSADLLAAPTPPTKPWLIAPTGRLKFISLFTLLTFLGGLVAARVALRLLPELDPSGSVGLAQAGNGLALVLTGVAIGAAQGFMLRRSVSSWQWIVATSLGWLVSSVVALSWLASSGGLLSNLAFIWLGFAQWLVLRQVAKPVWFWILLPCVASLMSYLLSPLFDAVTGATGDLITFLLLTINQFAVLGLVEGIGLCTLRQKSQRSPRQKVAAHDPPASVAPQIRDPQQLETLSQQLLAQLQPAWSAATAGEEDLIYLVDISATGAIATYQPINQAAYDSVEQTPLPTLLAQANPDAASGLSTPLARFQVIFGTEGELTIRPWGASD